MVSYQPKHRARTPADDLQEVWERASERNKVRFKPFEKPYCQEFDDLLDGFVIHAPACPLYQDSAVSSSAQCIDFRHVRVWPPGLAQVR